jgi:bacteriocin-like protein
MSRITIKDITQDHYQELSTDELKNIIGGWGPSWDDIKKKAKKVGEKISGGVKRFGEGVKDGGTGENDHNDLWYNLGHGIDRLIP